MNRALRKKESGSITFDFSGLNKQKSRSQRLLFIFDECLFSNDEEIQYNPEVQYLRLN